METGMAFLIGIIAGLWIGKIVAKRMKEEAVYRAVKEEKRIQREIDKGIECDVKNTTLTAGKIAEAYTQLADHVPCMTSQTRQEDQQRLLDKAEAMINIAADQFQQMHKKQGPVFRPTDAKQEMAGVCPVKVNTTLNVKEIAESIKKGLKEVCGEEKPLEFWVNTPKNKFCQEVTAAEKALGYINLAKVADYQPQKVLLSKAEKVLAERADELTMAEQANGYIKIAACAEKEEKKRLIRKAEEILDGNEYEEEKLSENCHGGHELLKSVSLR